jgi:hypothetical protein
VIAARRAAGAVGTIAALGDKTLQAELAGLPEVKGRSAAGAKPRTEKQVPADGISAAVFPI